MLTCPCFTETPVTPALNIVLKWEVWTTLNAFPNLSSDVGSSITATTAQGPRSVRMASQKAKWSSLRGWKGLSRERCGYNRHFFGGGVTTRLRAWVWNAVMDKHTWSSVVKIILSTSDPRFEPSIWTFELRFEPLISTFDLWCEP